MEFNNLRVYNFEGAFRGMRNPKNSWDKSDSVFGLVDDVDIALQPVVDAYVNIVYPEYKQKEEPTEIDTKHYEQIRNDYIENLKINGILAQSSGVYEVAFLGPNDLDLAQKLIQGGSEHRKFMRQIFVSVDITAPIFWWKEMDTYKVGTVANSTSTMHKLASTPITPYCFELGDYCPTNTKVDDKEYNIPEDIIIPWLENLRQTYNETKDKRFWKELIRWLPESWLQTRTWTGSYENLYSIYHQRKNHKLAEWSEAFVQFIQTLPYAQNLIINN